jgi:ubiquinone/menaquinone biosynthesis C-methylase UbiE
MPKIPRDFCEFTGRQGSRYLGYYPDNDFISRNLFWFGDFEPWIGKTLERLAKPSLTAIDIGANIGVTAITMARAVGSSGQVICFEPMPQHLSRLRQNIENNRLPRVRIEPGAAQCRELSSTRF